MEKKLYGGTYVLSAQVRGLREVTGYETARSKTAPGEKLRLVRSRGCRSRPVIVELLGSFTCGNPYEENVCLGWLEGDEGAAVARLMDEGASLFGVVESMGEGEMMVISVVMREKRSVL